MATRKVYFSNIGIPATGLTLSWEYLVKESDGSSFTPQPTFTEIGGGWYKYDINPTENLVGVIDGSATLGNDSERYVPVYFSKFDYLFDIRIIPTYDEDTDSLTYMAFVLQNGQLVTSGLTNCTLKIYDKTHSLLFTVSSVAVTNGVFVLTKSSPGLIKNTSYYVIADITIDGIVSSSIDTYFSLE